MHSFTFLAQVGALVPFFLESVLAANASEWRSRSIYQVMTDRYAPANGSQVGHCDQQLGTYCGGTWRGLQDNLDYIQGMNFDAIWMSPIVANIPNWTADGMAYAGYWQQDLFSTNDAFGTEDDLQSLITEIHKRGMYFMMDIVVNHMAFNGKVDEIDYKTFHPFNDQKYFHSYCASGYDDQDLDNLENCWLGSEEVPLADIDTEDSFVQQLFGMWIQNQVWKFGVDGLRIDAGINVDPEFFPPFMKAANTFALGEVYTSHDEIACQWEGPIGSILNYPLYWRITDAFSSPDGSMGDLADILSSERNNCHDPTLFGTFSENHDVPRFGNHTDDISQAENVAAFVVMSDGIPVVYQGQEQHLEGGTNPFTNREPLWQEGMDTTAPMYQLFATLNLFRRHITRNYADWASTNSDVIQQDSHTLVLKKGADGQATLSAFSNNGKSSPSTTTKICSDHGYPKGTKLTDVVSCSTYSVGNDNCINVQVTSGKPAVLFSQDKLAGSTLCGDKSKSDVETTELAVVSTSITTSVSGTLTVLHSATTMPWADAPASITAPSSDGQNGWTSASATSAAGLSFDRSTGVGSAIVIAISSIMFTGGLITGLGRFMT